MRYIYSFTKTVVALALAITGCINAYAYDFKVDGIYYNYLDKSAKTVAVTHGNGNYGTSYSGSIKIPPAIIINDNIYTVTKISNSAFRQCDISNISIPNTITEIEYDSFENCSITEVNISDLSAWCKISFVNRVANPLYHAKKFNLNGNEIKDLVIPNDITQINNFAFYNCTGLTSVTIPNSVTSIGEEVFYGCTGLTSVTIPNSVTEIGEEVFYGCTGLTSVTIPNSVTEIGEYAFYSCSGLTSVTIPNSVTEIGEYAFYSCSGLTSIYIPNSVRIIGDMAFLGCSGMTKLTIEDGTKTLSLGVNYYDCPLDTLYLGRNISYDKSPFANIKTLKSVTFGNSVTEIGNGAFNNCTGLISITIPNSVTEIGDFAFSGCRSLTHLKLADGHKSISGVSFPESPIETLYLGRNASGKIMSGKTSLKKLTIGNTVYSIVSSAFNGCSCLTEVNISDLSAWCKISFGDSAANPLYYAKKLKLNGTEITNLVIPNDITQINNFAFYNCSGLTSITIPNSVTEIGNYAFNGCTKLAKITIEDGTKTLSLGYNKYESDSYNYTGKGLFYDCPLENLYLGRNLAYETSKSYGYSPFYYKSKLKTITIGDSVTTIGEKAFYNCSGLTSITIPNSATSICYYAFENCRGLTEVNISDLSAWCKISFGNRAANPLYYAKKLKLNGTEITNLVIPNDITEIKDYAFYNCSGLTSITIPNSVTEIGNGAFDNCSGLTSVTIPNSVTEIGSTAFYNCSGLTSISIPNSVIDIGKSAFNGCTGLTSITIPNSVTWIGNNAFDGCTSLAELIFEDGKETLSLEYNNYNSSGDGEGLFYDCPLENLYLGRNLTYETSKNYGYSPFTYIETLKSVAIGKSATSIETNAFYGCTGLTEITVDSGNAKYDSRDNCNAIIETTTNTLIYGCKSSNIPNSVTSIGASAFYGCTGLTSVTIPNSVTSIGEEVFYGCTGLTEVNISDLSAWCKINFKSINSNPLYYAEHLYLNGEEIKNLVIPNDITYINGIAFYNCSGLTSITIPNSVTKIGTQAFCGCTGLTNVNISDLSAWCKISFRDSAANPLCYAKKLKLNGTEITNLVIPNDITEIKALAFYNCTGLTEVTIGNSVTSISESSFSGCSGLTGTLTIPNSVTEIGNNAFYGCIGLTSVTIPNSVTSIGNDTFNSCSGLTEVNYNAVNCTSMGSDYYHPVFSGCTNLKTINIGNNVKTIPSYAFYSCSGLTEVTIGNSVTEIGEYAFYSCSLDSITSYCMTPPLCYSYAFSGSYSALLKVPEGTKISYANALEWYKFDNIQEIAGVEDVLIDNLIVKIAIENGNISINGIDSPQVEVYNINGKCVYSGNDTSIPVSTTGVYILRINGKPYKIVNK